MALTFVAGHVFGSICAPIALAESWWPQWRREPWLGWFGLGVVSVLWLILLGRWSRRAGWTPTHVLAAVVGDLLSIGGPALTTTPPGDLDQAAKLLANALLLALVLAVAWWGFVREARCARAQPAARATV